MTTFSCSWLKRSRCQPPLDPPSGKGKLERRQGVRSLYGFSSAFDLNRGRKQAPQLRFGAMQIDRTPEATLLAQGAYEACKSRYVPEARGHAGRDFTPARIGAVIRRGELNQ